jgi:hypothetical protein
LLLPLDEVYSLNPLKPHMSMEGHVIKYRFIPNSMNQLG